MRFQANRLVHAQIPNNPRPPENPVPGASSLFEKIINDLNADDSILENVVYHAIKKSPPLSPEEKTRLLEALESLDTNY